MKHLGTSNEVKYKNARFALLVVIIFSILNLFSVLFLDIYFIFSIYSSQLLVTIGQYLYTITSVNLFVIIFDLLAFFLIVPFFICWLFSKNKVGWIICALVLISVDSVIFIIDFISLLMAGEFVMIIDLFVRTYIIVSIALGVKSGFNYKKEKQQIEEVKQNEQPQNLSGNTREITITRIKMFAACLVSIVCYVNGEKVGSVKNGKSITLQVPIEAFELTVSYSNGLALGQHNFSEGDAPLKVNLKPKIRWKSNEILIELQ